MEKPRRGEINYLFLILLALSSCSELRKPPNVDSLLAEKCAAKDATEVDGESIASVSLTLPTGGEMGVGGNAPESSPNVVTSQGNGRCSVQPGVGLNSTRLKDGRTVVESLTSAFKTERFTVFCYPSGRLTKVNFERNCTDPSKPAPKVPNGQGFSPRDRSVASPLAYRFGQKKR